MPSVSNRKLWHPHLYLAKDSSGDHYEIRHIAQYYDVSVSFIQTKEDDAPGVLNCECRFVMQDIAEEETTFLQVVTPSKTKNSPSVPEEKSINIGAFVPKVTEGENSNNPNFRKRNYKGNKPEENKEKNHEDYRPKGLYGDEKTFKKKEEFVQSKKEYFRNSPVYLQSSTEYFPKSEYQPRSEASFDKFYNAEDHTNTKIQYSQPDYDNSRSEYLKSDQRNENFEYETVRPEDVSRNSYDRNEFESPNVEYRPDYENNRKVDYENQRSEGFSDYEPKPAYNEYYSKQENPEYEPKQAYTEYYPKQERFEYQPKQAYTDYYPKQEQYQPKQAYNEYNPKQEYYQERPSYPEHSDSTNKYKKTYAEYNPNKRFDEDHSSRNDYKYNEEYYGRSGYNERANQDYVRLYPEPYTPQLVYVYPYQGG